MWLSGKIVCVAHTNAQTHVNDRMLADNGRGQMLELKSGVFWLVGCCGAMWQRRGL